MGVQIRLTKMNEVGGGEITLAANLEGVKPLGSAGAVTDRLALVVLLSHYPFQGRVSPHTAA